MDTAVAQELLEVTQRIASLQVERAVLQGSGVPSPDQLATVDTELDAYASALDELAVQAGLETGDGAGAPRVAASVRQQLEAHMAKVERLGMTRDALVQTIEAEQTKERLGMSPGPEREASQAALREVEQELDFLGFALDSLALQAGGESARAEEPRAPGEEYEPSEFSQLVSPRPGTPPAEARGAEDAGGSSSDSEDLDDPRLAAALRLPPAAARSRPARRSGGIGRGPGSRAVALAQEQVGGTPGTPSARRGARRTHARVLAKAGLGAAMRNLDLSIA